MSDERTKGNHKPSTEFWTIIGALIAMGALTVAIGASILTVTGWLREDVRDLGAGMNALQGEVHALAVGFKALEVKVDTIDRRVDRIDKRVDSIDKRVDSIDRRLAVVERHVLGIASADRNDEGA